MKRFYFWTILLANILSVSTTKANESVFWEHVSTHEIDRNNAAKVLEYAKTNLKQEGRLKEGADGYVYLKVDSDYIDKLFPLLSQPGYVKPPFFRRSDSPGAHISVFYKDEREQTGKIQEIGKWYSFKITGLTFVPVKTHEYIVLQVESPELEQLRQKYGFTPLLKGHDFHITIAKKKFKKLRY